jgi:hypothetical protein
MIADVEIELTPEPLEDIRCFKKHQKSAPSKTSKLSLDIRLTNRVEIEKDSGLTRCQSTVRK